MTVSLKHTVYANNQRIDPDYQFNVPPMPPGSLSFATALRNPVFRLKFQEANPAVEIPPTSNIWLQAGLWKVNK